MAKNITIQEGGVAKSLTVDKLKTDLVGGGTCNWVPEDETQLITKSVTKNGTYKANRDGAYGYSKVIVNVAGGSVTGRGSDGNTHTYSNDDQGNIVDEVVPDTIVIFTPPTFTGPYGNHAYIGFDGLVVKAYDGNGNLWTGDGQYPDGVIPNNELIFPITVAVYDPDAGGGPGYYWDSIQCPIYVSEGEYGAVQNTANNPGTFQYGPLTIDAIMPVDSSRFKCEVYLSGQFFGRVDGATDGRGFPIHYWISIHGSRNPEFVPSYAILYFASADAHQIGEYGFSDDTLSLPSEYIHYSESGEGGVPIPVQWQRPGDGKVLETSFNITVVDVSPNYY